MQRNQKDGKKYPLPLYFASLKDASLATMEHCGLEHLNDTPDTLYQRHIVISTFHKLINPFCLQAIQVITFYLWKGTCFLLHVTRHFHFKQWVLRWHLFKILDKEPCCCVGVSLNCFISLYPSPSFDGQHIYSIIQSVSEI